MFDTNCDHDLFINNLVVDVKANPRGQWHAKQRRPRYPTFGKNQSKSDVAQSDLKKAEEFNGQLTDVSNQRFRERSN